MSIPQSARELTFSHPLMSALSPKEISILSDQLSYKRLSAGELLFTEGDLGSSCYLIISGSVLVSKRLESGLEQTLATLGSGELLGQIALIDRKPRSASCRAGSEGVQLVSFDGETFEQLYSSQNAFAYKVLDHIVTDLSKRLRGANAQLSRARQGDATQRHRLSLKAAQVIAGHRYTDEELDAIEVIKTDFEESLKYHR